MARRRRKNKKAAKRVRPLQVAKCRDCGVERKAVKMDWFRASPPRCYACGGMLDFVRYQHRAQVGKGTRHRPQRPSAKAANRPKDGSIAASQKGQTACTTTGIVGSHSDAFGVGDEIRVVLPVNGVEYVYSRQPLGWTAARSNVARSSGRDTSSVPPGVAAPGVGEGSGDDPQVNG